MFFIYQIIISLILIFSPLILIYRIFKNKEDKNRFKEKFSIQTKIRSNGKLIWFHGASVGELMSIIPLIKKYEKEKSIHQILITSSTLSSSKIIKKFNFKKTIHQFYPIDHIIFVNKFLNYWRPNAVIFIESEIWPCMFKKINDKNIPLLLLNARLTKNSINKWMKLRNFSKSIFDKISIAYPQNIETKLYLKKIGFNKTKNLGNLKFAENYDDKLLKLNEKLKLEFIKKKVWVASSTHYNEEIFCAKAHITLKKKFKNLLTIIIPRHIHRVEEIVSDLKKLNLNVTLHSLKKTNLNNIDIYIVDTFGETKKFHKFANSVFLGGSIVKRGGQNPLEAARFGSRIIHGPNTQNFNDIYKLLRSFNISKKITTPEQLASSVIFKKNKKIGVKLRNIGKKILNDTIKELDNQINNEFKKT
tara:strand:- start:548 stop:1798 length:1251 start_codon:yes stop_codon:yes gene_type:complete